MQEATLSMGRPKKPRGDRTPETSASSRKKIILALKASATFEAWYLRLKERFSANHLKGVSMEIPDSVILHEALKALAEKEKFNEPMPER